MQPDILHVVGVLTDELPDRYLTAGLLCVLFWLFGVSASVALNLGWFALLFTVSWPILFGVGALLILLFFSVLRHAKFKQSSFRYYLMVPVVLFTQVLLTIAQVWKESRPDGDPLE